MLAYNRRELLGLLGSAVLAKGRPQPNILYIMADDHAAHAISAYGSRINQTPNIGKWHLVSEPTGFDYWNILPGKGVYYNPAFLTSGGRKQYTGYCTDLIGDFTLDWLK